MTSNTTADRARQAELRGQVRRLKAELQEAELELIRVSRRLGEHEDLRPGSSTREAPGL